MTSKILKFENKTLLFIQIEKKSIVNYNMATITAAKLQSLRACFGDVLQSFTVILIAVKNHTDITYKVLKKRVYVHAQSAQSCFSILPIHNVVFHNSTLLTAALLLHLSDPSIVNKTSREPLNWACTKTTNKLVKY